MGRNLTADKTPLLEDAEQNIGNSVILRPQVASYPPGYESDPAPPVLPLVGTVIPQAAGERILNLNAGGSASGQTMTIAVSATRILKGEQNPYPGFPGPITGIVEFGNGGRWTRIEFDVPIGPFAGLFTSASSAIQPQDGVVIITVPAGALRVYARYDNLLIAPLLGTDPPISQAQWTTLNGVAIPFVGPGGPLLVQNATGPGNSIVPAEPVLVQAMATYFGRAPTHSRVYKTLNMYISQETQSAPPPLAPAIQIGSPPVRSVAGFGNFNFWALPPYTKRIKLLRFPNAADLAVILHDGIRPVDFFTTGANNSFPEFDVDGSEIIIGISSQNSQGNAVTMLKAICEVGI
jgi:hypothetical protein